MLIKEMDEEKFCYIHQGGELVRGVDGSAEYKGGCNYSLIVKPNTSYDQFVSQVCNILGVKANEVRIRYTLKFEPFMLVEMRGDNCIGIMLRFNDAFCRVYVSPRVDADAGFVTPTRALAAPVVSSSNSSNVNTNGNTNFDSPKDISYDRPSIQLNGFPQICANAKETPLDEHGSSQFPNASSNSADVNTPKDESFDPPMDISTDRPRISDGFLQRCVETTPTERLDSSQLNAVMGSGQTFSKATNFRDAVYLMSLAGKFQYSFKRNTRKHMTVVCKVDECPWKITCRAIGSTDIVQVHTFKNVHEHGLEDVPNFSPLVRSSRASLVIDNAIRSNPDYHPRQICDVFIKQHGMRLSYSQAWQLKQKAMERIYGLPKNYYKLLPWMCERIVQLNPGTIVELTHSNDGRFEQLFIAHAISIQGFTMGCRPIVSIDSSHMSGPYNDAIFFATSYDANNCMFPLAIGVMNSENYETWSWFLEKLKKVFGNKEVVVISDRRPDLLRSVHEIFGVENHAYCYHHLKEDFINFLNNDIIKGKQGKENALQWLDRIAYARLEDDYNSRMFELRKFNDALATWVEDNAPEHWAMSKFPKKRWDKMTTDFEDPFTVWLKDQCHHSICDFILEHMIKLGAMLTKQEVESRTWKGSVGPNIKDVVMLNIAKGEAYQVAPLLNGPIMVTIGESSSSVEIMNKTCTCKAWQMLGIPCEHACAALLFTGQNVYDFVEDYYKFPHQELIYSGSFYGIHTHGKPSVGTDGVVRDSSGKIYPSLDPPHHMKRSLGRPKKKCVVKSQTLDKRTLYCSRCQMAGHNRKTCKRIRSL